MFLPAVSFAAISLIVTPPYHTCLTANTASSFTFQTQAAAAGGRVQFELFFDFNNNGIIDGDEWPVCTQVLVDNVTVGEDDCFAHDSNPSSPDITTNFDFGSAYLPVGNYIVRVQNSLAEVATAQFCVTAASAPRTVTGTVYEQGTSTPVPNAPVSAEDTETEDFISAAFTDNGGFYTLQMPVTGAVEICAEKYGYIGTCSYVTVPSGGISNYDLYLIPADTTITGTVREYGTGNPVWGAEVDAETIDEKGSWTTTDINGNFTLPVLSGIEWNVDTNEPAGYFASRVPSNNCERNITITPTVGGPNIVDFTVHRETAWIEGTVKDEYGNKVVEGASFFAYRINTLDPCIRNLDNERDTNALGQVTIGLEAGDWRVGLCVNCDPVKVGGEQKEMVPPPHEDVNNLTTGEHRNKTLNAYYADGVLVGRVFREDGKTPAPAGVWVSAWSDNALNGVGQTSVGFINTETETDEDGYFRIPVLSGTWGLRASFWGRTSDTIVVTLITNGNDVIEPGETSTDINLIVPLEIWNEVCGDYIDNDGDGLVDCADPECCDDPVCFGNPVCTVASETLLSQEVTLDNVEVTTDDFAGTSTINFTNLEFVSITTGAFAGKGFSKGECEATFAGVTYEGDWRGIMFLKPSEKRIYLKGAITGEINATVEGYLTESVLDSGNYDQYQATWNIGRLGGTAVSATIVLNGDVSYGSESTYNGTDLYLLQANIEATDKGHYSAVGPLNIVLTHLRVVSEDNPYVGEGFSIISYNSESGSGQGWTYDRLLVQGIVEMKGLFSSPLFGIASATLNETELPRTLSLRIERIDLGIPPMADLEVKTWGPERVSPGQTVDYLVEYRNDGIFSAEDAVIVLELPSLAQYLSSTNEGIYRWETHEAFWKLGTVIPQQRGVLSVKVYYPWGLPQGTPQMILAKYGTSSTEKDFFLNPDREPLFDLQDYLDYQPLVISPEDILTPEAFTEELASDARLNDLHQYAIELGYSDRLALKKILNDGTNLTEMLMAKSSDQLLLLVKGNDTVVLGQPDGTTISIFDREGGISWDFANISLESWGDLAQSVSSLKIQFCSKLHICRDNCMEEQFSYLNLIGLERSIFGNVKSCLCVGLPPVAPICAGACVKSVISLGISIKQWKDAGDKCLDECIENSMSHCCSPEDDRIFCSGNRLYRAVCNGATGEINMTYQDCASFTPNICFAYFGYCNSATRRCETAVEFCGTHGLCGPGGSVVCRAHDPNIKYGPSGAVVAGQTLDYRVEFENEGEGIAFGVYFTDTLDEDLDESTLVIGPVIQIIDGVVGPEIGPPGTYNPATRTITWFVGGEGEIGPNVGGYAEISVNVKSGAANGTEIINYGTVYFPSVPEETRTNAIVSRIPLIEDCSDEIDNDEDGLIDCEDPDCFGQDCTEVCDDEMDNDGDSFVDCADTDCPPCPEICDDGLDNDRDGLVDCDDPDCTCCDSTNYSRGTSSITFKGGTKDKATLRMCVNKAFCDALKAGVEEITLTLDDCNEITVPGGNLKSNKKKTKFSASSSTYTLKIDCKKGTLTLTLKNTALKDCVSNPVKTCIGIKDGPCLCAEGEFEEQRDRKDNLKKLFLKVVGACTP